MARIDYCLDLRLWFIGTPQPPPAKISNLNHPGHKQQRLP